MNLQHYVIQTHPCEEKTASAELLKAGFWTCWLASREEYRTKHGRRFIDVATFPSYIFVGFDVADNVWKTIVQMRGVKRILGSDPLHPTPLPCGAIDRLRARFDAGEFKVQVPVPIAVDERIMIQAGPFAGHAGVCTMSRGERIKVLMEILGDQREIEVWSGIVTRAPALVAAQ